MKDHHEGILQLKSQKGRYWMLDIGGQLCKVGHKSSKGTIYEMGI
jgi:hypothetical protein